MLLCGKSIAAFRINPENSRRISGTQSSAPEFLRRAGIARFGRFLVRRQAGGVAPIALAGRAGGVHVNGVVHTRRQAGKRMVGRRVLLRYATPLQSWQTAG